MIRRCVHLVAANYGRCVYSLHRLDVAKHLFYPSTAEAEAAKAKEAEDSSNGGGGGKLKPPRTRIERLLRLPDPLVCFQQFRPAPAYQYVYDDNDHLVAVESHPIHQWSPSQEMFALLSPRGRIFHATEEGHAVLYDAGGSITTLPTAPASTGPTVTHPSPSRSLAPPPPTTTTMAAATGKQRRRKTAST